MKATPTRPIYSPLSQHRISQWFIKCQKQHNKLCPEHRHTEQRGLPRVSLHHQYHHLQLYLSEHPTACSLWKIFSTTIIHVIKITTNGPIHFLSTLYILQMFKDTWDTKGRQWYKQSYNSRAHLFDGYTNTCARISFMDVDRLEISSLVNFGKTKLLDTLIICAAL